MDAIERANDHMHKNGNAAPVDPPTTVGLSDAQRHRLHELLTLLRQFAPRSSTETPAPSRRSRFASYLRGVGSIVDIFPARRVHEIRLPKASIAEAMQNDFRRIGQDLYKAMFANLEE